MEKRESKSSRNTVDMQIASAIKEGKIKSRNRKAVISQLTSKAGLNRTKAEPGGISQTFMDWARGAEETYPIPKEDIPGETLPIES